MLRNKSQNLLSLAGVGALAGFLVAASPLQAEEAAGIAVERARTPLEQTNTVERLAEMQGNTALINAQAAQIKAQAELQEAHNALREAILEGAELSGEATKSEDAAQESKAVSVELLPKVLSIYGTGKNFYALLRYPSGLRVDVRVGEKLDDDYVVKSITASRVMVSRDGETRSLQTYSVSTTNTFSR